MHKLAKQITSINWLTTDRSRFQSIPQSARKKLKHMTESTILSENKCDQYRMSVPINVMYHFVGVRGGHKSAQNTDTPKHHKSASNFQTTSH
jgi:hypothetical protein